MLIPKDKPVRGYKVFDLTNKGELLCRNYKFSEDKVNSVAGTIKVCSNGLHYCKKASDCLTYYPYNGKQSIVCEVEGYGNSSSESDKIAVQYLKIVRRLNWNEFFILAEIYPGTTQTIFVEGYVESDSWNNYKKSLKITKIYSHNNFILQYLNRNDHISFIKGIQFAGSLPKTGNFILAKVEFNFKKLVNGYQEFVKNVIVTEIINEKKY